ncbi:hypothetical protein [Kitasatospora sp. NBC_00315]|uniref:hypothetical protein n=1 Tax=Kitasatospora sp. NBC_00315 TaxID=2975963 RepID=UPI00324FC796
MAGFTFRVLLAAGLLLAPAGAAMADGPTGDVHQCQVTYICTDVHEPGTVPTTGPTGGGGASGGGTATCSWNGQDWACWDNDLGWFSTSNGCYYHLSDPQPPAGDPSWAGHQPADGGVYEVNCRQTTGGIAPGEPVFLAQAPGGPPPDDKFALANDARGRIRFDAPAPHVAPAAGAVVGLPVWLWFDWAAGTAAPAPGTVRGNYISVTATPVLQDVEWNFGHGQVKHCTTAGTPYEARFGREPSPDCGFTFTESSAVERASGAFSGTVTLTWAVTSKVVGTGEAIGTRPITMTVTTVPFALTVSEVQVLN